MTEYQYREATWDDIPRVTSVLCPADHKELWAATGLSTEFNLWSGMNNSSVCRVGCADGKPIIMYGVVPMRNIGIVWLAGADLLPHWREAYRSLGKELDLLCAGFKYVTNYMDGRQTTHRKFLERLGFVFDEYDTKICHEVSFIRFIKKVDNNV